LFKVSLNNWPNCFYRVKFRCITWHIPQIDLMFFSCISSRFCAVCLSSIENQFYAGSSMKWEFSTQFRQKINHFFSCSAFNLYKKCFVAKLITYSTHYCNSSKALFRYNHLHRILIRSPSFFRTHPHIERSFVKVNQ